MADDGSRQPRLRINLLPGAPHPPVEVPFAASTIAEKQEAELKKGVGEERWPSFKRLHDEFEYSLRCALDAVSLLGDAITPDDFERWTIRARKHLDITAARFAMIDADFERANPEYAGHMRTRLSGLRTEFERVASQSPPKTAGMFITGEYER